jgi:phospholipid/cholesterol/gamma-HCH transport system ATP-binding protein
MITFKNVTFAYGEKTVLRNVSFHIGENESAVIMGPSGSGKSTILRLILGLNCPQSGQILVDEGNICTMRERDKREVRKRIGMVFQDGALFDSLTVGENVGYYLFEHTDLPTKEIERRVVEILGFVGLNANELIDRLPEQLSGGMQRRVAIARALLSTNPKIMLYDEPTTGLDPQSDEQVMTLINRLTRDSSISTIVVTHQIADALGIANRFIVIYDGQVAFDGTVDELRDSRDTRVRNFLAPFESSVSLVLEKQLVGRHHAQGGGADRA